MRTLVALLRGVTASAKASVFLWLSKYGDTRCENAAGHALGGHIGYGCLVRTTP